MARLQKQGEMGNLLLAEHAWQVEDFLLRDMHRPAHWVALGPSAMHVLDEKNISYRIPEEFYSQEDLQAEMLQTHQKVEALCRSIDNLLLERHAFLREYEMKPFWFHIFTLSMVFDGTVARIYKLRRILDAFKKETLYAHLLPSCRTESFGFGFSNFDTIWGGILTLPGWNRPVQFLKKNNAAQRHKIELSIAMRQVLKGALRNRYEGCSAGDNERKKRHDKGTVLMVDYPSEWEHIIPRLKEEGWDFFYTTSAYFARYGSSHTYPGESSLFKDNRFLADSFYYEGVDFYPFLKSRFSWLADHAKPLFLRVARRMESLLRKYNVRMVFSSQGPSGIVHAVNQTARKSGIPVFDFQHGSIYPSECGLMQYNEVSCCMASSVFFVYGDGVREAIKAYQRKDSKTDVVSAGSLVLQGLMRKHKNYKRQKKEETKLVYATTNYFQNVWYFGFSPPFSDCYFYLDQYAVVKGLKNMQARTTSKMQVIVKLHPAANCVCPPWAGRLKEEHSIQIETALPFVSFLDKVDAVVLDFPSTTLLQALTTALPVFVLTRHWRFMHATRTLLERRAVCADTAQSLLQRVDDFLQNGSYPADVQDASFLSAYGTHESGPDLSDKVFEIIRQSAKETRPENAYTLS